MEKDSLFIVIEGLDGSGKTSVARQLANVLDHYNKESVKLTFEPHDPSCAGIFIRQVLMKKIRNFSPQILPLAFATNRLDHCDREISPWLAGGKGRIVICDRYYLSSLVYQSSDDFSFSTIMEINKFVRKPDIIFFINVSDKICYERMKIRNQPKELFEKNLSDSRKKYIEAIEFLKKTSNDYIEEIDGNGTIGEVVATIMRKIYEFNPKWEPQQPTISTELIAPHIFTLNGKYDYCTDDFIEDLECLEKYPYVDENIEDITAFEERLRQEISQKLSSSSFDELGSLFLNYVKKLGFSVGEKMPWTHLDCYELEYKLPANIIQRGTALLINETQRYDVIMQSITIPGLYEMSDFMIIFSPGPAELVTKYYERDKIQYNSRNNEVAVSLTPTTHLVTQKELTDFIFDTVQSICADKKNEVYK